jgi:hypothetical protein
MKCFVVLSLVLSAACGQFLADTPEVTEAKHQFAAAYNAAARAAAAASPAAGPVVGVSDDGSDSPAALPYVHEEILAEPYVHSEVPALAADQQQQEVPLAAPQQQIQQAAFSFNSIPQQQQQQPQFHNLNQQPISSFNGACFNWKGEGVPCRTDFTQ